MSSEVIDFEMFLNNPGNIVGFGGVSVDLKTLESVKECPDEWLEIVLLGTKSKSGKGEKNVENIGEQIQH